MVYNRYIRNDRGVYTRVPESDSPSSGRPVSETVSFSDTQQQKPEPKEFHPPPPPPPQTFHSSFEDSFSGTLRRLLDRFHLENVDTGDLLLLLLLFLLFKEDADEELLFALGLLLIL